MAANRYAIVTGGNRGLGFAICRQLACSGSITVILTARDENRGLQAVQDLKNNHGVPANNIVFHQLDVADSSSVARLADFVKTQFGKLDILVNNAFFVGCMLNEGIITSTPIEQINWDEATTNTYDLAEKGLKTNYYGAKGMIEAFLPLMELSDSPRIVNITSAAGGLQHVKNEWAKGLLSDAENLSEERLEQVLNQFTKDFKEGLLETANNWTTLSPSYVLSKACLNAYTRIVANRYPSFCVNCVCPGFVKTDSNFNTGYLTPEEAAVAPVRLALLADGGVSGRCFSMMEEASF